MRLLPPMPGNPAIAEGIRSASDAYTRPQAEVAREQEQYMDDQVSDFRDMLDRTGGDEGLDFGQGPRTGRGGKRGRRGRRDDREDVKKDGKDDGQDDDANAAAGD